MASGIKTHKLDEIDIMDLRAIKAIAETGNITLAAKKLGVSQPLVSYRLQVLENFFQRPLYYRNTKADVLTPLGKHIYKYVDKILDDYQEMLTLAKGYK